MGSIYLQTGEGQVGPLLEADVRAAYESGLHLASTMSWKPGDSKWKSLGARWGRPSNASNHALGSVAGVGLFLFFGAGILLPAGVFDDVLPPAFGTVDVQAALAVVVGLLALTLLATCVRRSVRGGRLRLPVVIACMAFLATSLVSFGMLRKEAEVEKVRQQPKDATMTLSSDGDVLHIDGYIADEFVQDLIDSLARAPHLSYIQINSPGGFIEDALKAAAMIKTRAIRVRVTSQCASACVLLWAASPTRELGLHGSIGLHQSSITVDMPSDWGAAALGMLEPDSKALLKDAGFSDALLAKRSATSPQNLESFGPIELLEEGVSLRVVSDDGLPVSRAEMVMADVLRRDGTGGDARRLFMAYALAAPSTTLPLAEAIRTAQLKGSDLSSQSAELGTDARLFALSHASDSAILRWASAMQGLIGDAIARQNTSACATLVAAGLNGKPDEASRARKLKALADLMEEIPANAPRARSDSAAARAMAAFIQSEFASLVRQGHPTDWNSWSALQRCELNNRAYSAALDQRPRDAATAIRVIEGIEQAPMTTPAPSDLPTFDVKSAMAPGSEPTQSELQARFDDIQERARREHPDMPLTDAMKEVSSEDAAKKLTTQTAQGQAQTAASMFWGFYFMNTRGRADYCAKRGVDINPFVKAFTAAHTEELTRAQQIYAQSGVDPKYLVAKLKGQLASMVEQDMRDLLKSAQLAPEEACPWLNENADTVAANIQLPRQVKQALMSK